MHRHDRGDYVDVLSPEAGISLTLQETRCLAGAMVDVVGVDTLEGIDDATFPRAVVNAFVQRDGGGFEDLYESAEAACS